ncbi:MAG: hypothetical protein HC914_21565, partial [Chloroflexaceae bacterium]|nr:hypothetical protein [Chloroflexaceae bacterium]
MARLFCTLICLLIITSTLGSPFSIGTPTNSLHAQERETRFDPTRDAAPPRFEVLTDHTGGGSNGTTETFSARVVEDFGQWSTFDDEWNFTRSNQWTNIRAWPRKMAVNVLVEADNTEVAIMFTAEAYVDTPRKRMFVRALIDGKPTNPEDVVFAMGTDPQTRAARAFIFTDMLDSGLHTIEMQWLVDDGATAALRNAALMVRQNAFTTSQGQTMDAVTPPSGPSVSTNLGTWSNIPGLSGTVHTQSGDTLIASISAESATTRGGTMFVRALVNGTPMLPTDVLFAKSETFQARSMTFGLNDMPAGFHTVQFQWAVSGGEAMLGDRSIVLATGQPADPSLAQVFVAAPSGPAVATTSTQFVPMPTMQASGSLPPNAEIVVVLSGEPGVPATGQMEVRLTIDGQVVEASQVQLAHTDAYLGTQAFVFNAKHINVGQGGCANCTVQVEWRSVDGQQVFMGDRSMVVIAKPGSVPDLAEPPAYGTNNFGVEPVFGMRPVLTILWDPQRPQHPAPTTADLETLLYGGADSMHDYYTRVSGGRFGLQNAAVLGPYAAEEDAAHYWQSPYPACDAPDSTGYTGGHARKWAEAINAANDDFDFAAYDTNRDGVLDPTEELAILIVIPQNTEAGYVRMLNPYCDGSPVTVDNVSIPFISEWYAKQSNANMLIPAHELAHLVLMLDDMYNESLNHAVEAGRLTLMEQFKAGTFTPHIDGPNKLALGWVTPQILTQNSAVSLEDVKHSNAVVVLPRLNGGDGKEYYL